MTTWGAPPETSCHIGSDDLLPIFEPHRFRRGAPGNACVINENINGSELPNRRFNQVSDVVGLRDVAAKGKGFDTQFFDFRGCLFATLPLASAVKRRPRCSRRTSQTWRQRGVRSSELSQPLVLDAS